MTEYLLDKVSGAAAVGQVDDLAEGDAGCLGADLPAVLAPQLRIHHHNNNRGANTTNQHHPQPNRERSKGGGGEREERFEHPDLEVVGVGRVVAAVAGLQVGEVVQVRPPVQRVVHHLPPPAAAAFFLARVRVRVLDPGRSPTKSRKLGARFRWIR